MIYLIGSNLLGVLAACRKDGPQARLIELNQCDLKCDLKMSRKRRLKLTIKILFCNYVLGSFSYWAGSSLIANHWNMLSYKMLILH